MKPIDKIQWEIRQWAEEQFGQNVSKDDSSPSFNQPLGSIPSLMGVAEELGELFHAVAYRHQGRGFRDIGEHRLAKIDAIGDLMIYLLDYCSRENIDLLASVNATWEKVCKRRQATWMEDKAKETQPESYSPQQIQVFAKHFRLTQAEMDGIDRHILRSNMSNKLCELLFDEEKMRGVTDIVLEVKVIRK